MAFGCSDITLGYVNVLTVCEKCQLRHVHGMIVMYRHTSTGCMLQALREGGRLSCRSLERQLGIHHSATATAVRTLV